MDNYDYIIIGAGSAGCAVARRLSDNPDVSVLLLEAGPPTDKFWVRAPAGMAKLFLDKDFNWSYFTEPMAALRNRRMYWPRGKGLGGSSAINGMIFIRGHQKDFDHWKSLGNAGWGFDDLLPIFKRMEHNERGEGPFHGAGGPIWISDPVIRHPSSIDFVESAVRAGIPRTDDLNGPVHDGVGFMQHSIRRGERQSAYTAYLKPVLGRANLTIRTGVFVQKILMEGVQAAGVEVTEGSLQRKYMAAREVILSAGALNSPQVLMLSGIGPGAELQHHGIAVVVDRQGVGQNLQDHFYIHCQARTSRDSSYNYELHGLRKYWQGLRYLLNRSGYLALGSSQVAAFVKSRLEEEYADLQISFRPMTFTYHTSGVVDVDPFPAISASVYRVRPSATGTVTLRSANPMEAPVFRPNFLSDQDDVAAMIYGIRKIREILRTEPIASRVSAEYAPGPSVQTDAQLLDFMQQFGNSAFHPAGTCKMGQDAMAVVDERLRVHGTERLRVIDASIMPRVTAGNTNAPSMMIGEKGAEMIGQDAAPRRPIG